MPKAADYSRLHVVLSPELHNQFMAACANRGVTASQVIRNAVRFFVNTPGVPSPLVAAESCVRTLRAEVGDLEDECLTFD